MSGQAGERPSRNLQHDAIFIAVGAIIMALTWPEPSDFRRGGPLMATVPVVVGGFLVARGVLGRPLTGSVTQNSMRVGAAIVAGLLFVCWRQLAG